MATCSPYQGALSTQIFKDFNLVAHLGEGSFGVVFSARKAQEDPEGQFPPNYAIKRIFTPFKQRKGNLISSDKIFPDILKEVRALYDLRLWKHRNVVRIYNAKVDFIPYDHLYGSDPIFKEFRNGEKRTGFLDTSKMEEVLECQGLPNSELETMVCCINIAMGLCTLGSLEDYLNLHKDEERPLKATLEFAMQMANGLRFIHGMGLIHRDLKPGNIYVSETKYGQILMKIGDFGLSKHINFETGWGGTDLFMAPEQGGVVGGPSNYGTPVDIYALALTIFCLLIPMPVNDDDKLTKFYKAVQTMRNVISRDSQDPPTPIITTIRQICGKIHEGLYPLLYRMMSSDPESRPTADNVYNELLTMMKSQIQLPMRIGVRKPPHPNIPIETELSKLEKFYSDGDTKGVIIEGPAGVGKTHLVLQFLDKILTEDTQLSAVFLRMENDTENRKGPLKHDVRSVFQGLHINCYRDNGIALDTTDIVQNIIRHSGFAQGNKLILVLDDVPNIPEIETCISQQSSWILYTDAPIFLIITRRESSPSMPMATIQLNPHINAEFGLEYLKKSLTEDGQDQPEDLDLPALNLMSMSLQTNPFSLKLATRILKANRKYGTGIQNQVEFNGYVAIKILTTQIYGFTWCSEDLDYKRYSDSLPHRVMIELTVEQMHESVKGDPELLDLVKTLYFYYYTCGEILNLDAARHEKRPKADEILSDYGLLVNGYHVCGYRSIAKYSGANSTPGTVEIKGGKVRRII